VPPAPLTRPVATRAWNTTVRHAHGFARVHLNLSGDGRPVLFIHEAAGASETLAALMDKLRAASLNGRPVITLDLPGHGESDALPDGVGFLEACRSAIAAVLDAFATAPVDAVGINEGATVLADFASQSENRLHALYLTGVRTLSAEQGEALAKRFAPVIESQWHGGHLLEYWHVARNRTLFWPWYEQTEAAVIDGDPHMDTHELHQRTLALMKSSPTLPRVAEAVFNYPLVGALSQLSVPTHQAAAPLVAEMLEFFAGVTHD